MLATSIRMILIFRAILSQLLDSKAPPAALSPSSVRTTPTPIKGVGVLSFSGFTLIEIMIVLGIIALLMSVAIPNMGLYIKYNISNGSKEIAGLVRTTHDEAVLKGKPHRLVIDFSKQEYWVEIGEHGFLLETREQEEERQRQYERLHEDDKKKVKRPAFSLAKSITKSKKKLPKGVRFFDIKLARYPDPINAGVAYIHFFPHGVLEAFTLHLADQLDRKNTIVVNPVTGKSRVIERGIDFKEALNESL
jgi:prepilin-type N-terminal cleavage/methylation domain-containing protein